MYDVCVYNTSCIEAADNKRRENWAEKQLSLLTLSPATDDAVDNVVVRVICCEIDCAGDVRCRVDCFSLTFVDFVVQIWRWQYKVVTPSGQSGSHWFRKIRTELLPHCRGFWVIVKDLSTFFSKEAMFMLPHLHVYGVRLLSYLLTIYMCKVKPVLKREVIIET